jgi:hypothetical protein
MLYGQLLIPPAVLAELSHPKTPLSVQNWLASGPAWLQVVHSQKHSSLGLSARQHQITVTSTLGVLDQAASRGWIDLAVAFDRLKQTSFRCPHALMSTLLEEDQQRKQKRS